MSIFNKVTKTFQWGPHTVTLETGEVARQSSGPVMVNTGNPASRCRAARTIERGMSGAGEAAGAMTNCILH